MTPQPYIDTEHNGDALPSELHADCLLCGHHDEWGAITLRLAWFREPARITAIPRCLDIDACMARVKANGESWPLLERVEQPGAPRQQPLEPPAGESADVQPKEAPDEWV
jgi:hypothetical protein